MTSKDGLNDDNTIQAVGVRMMIPAITSWIAFSQRIQRSVVGASDIALPHHATMPRKRLNASTAPNTIAVSVSINALA